MNDSLITIFTPTYNRAYTLRRLYDSLLKQTSNSFEWLIVDDGSSDNTEQLVNEFINNSNPFDIRYFKQNNSGKHVAINTGVNNANGYLFFIVDSDDYLTNDAIERILYWESGIADNVGYAGVSGCKGYNERDVIGTTFDGSFIDATSMERDKYSITGDKAEVFYTDVLKQHPFPVFEGENFLTESVVWERIANEGFKIRWFNEIIYICKYLEDGLTAKYIKLLMNNPRGFALSVNQKIDFYGYDDKRIDSERFDYYQIVKKNISFGKAAGYLGINKTQLLLSIIRYYYHVGKNKVKND